MVVYGGVVVAEETGSPVAGITASIAAPVAVNAASILHQN